MLLLVWTHGSIGIIGLIEFREFYSKNINEFSILTLNSNSFKNIIENKLDKFEPNFNFDENSNEEFTELPWVPGWCMFFKINDIKQLNYFDENIFLYFDELDLCKRFKKDNGKFYLLRNSLVKHEFHGTSKDLNKTKHFSFCCERAIDNISQLSLHICGLLALANSVHVRRRK